MKRLAAAALLFLTTWGCRGDPGSHGAGPAGGPSPSDRFEEEQTAKLLGVPARPFPAPQGVKGFDEVPDDAPDFPGEVRAREPTGPKPADILLRRRATAKGPEAREFVAYCGFPKKTGVDEFFDQRADDESRRSLEIAPGHPFAQKSLNRRHRYRRGWSEPPDIYIGTLSGGVLHPVLVFPDAGNQGVGESPPGLAIDSRGRCHLAVCDVLAEENNRFKLYYAVGDPATGKWEEAWLVQHLRGLTSSAKPICLRLGDSVELVWEWQSPIQNGAPMDAHTGLYHLEWSPRGFSPKVRVAPCSLIYGFAAEVDEARGLLLLAWNDSGDTPRAGSTYLAARPRGGRWSRPQLLLKQTSGLSLEGAGEGAFAVRLFERIEAPGKDPRFAAEMKLREFLVTFPP